MNILVMFRNRHETLKFSKLLSSIRIRNELVSAPASLGATCNLAIIFYERDLVHAITYLKTNNYISFATFYQVLPSMYGGFRYEKIKL